MTKTILFLADGMADDPLPELDGKTPVEHAATPHMDALAREGASGLFHSLPEAFPTSSDVANMSVLGYDLASCYPGRGPLEAMSQGIDLKPDDVAWRCNLIHADAETLIDYSGGHIAHADALQIMRDLAAEFNTPAASFHPGVSYRNLLVLHGPQFTHQVKYEKPDDHQGDPWRENLLSPVAGGAAAAASQYTASFCNDLILASRDFLAAHPVNAGRERPANMIWLWSPGKRPLMPPFSEKYAGARGAIISAVDVIFGLGVCAGLDLIKVAGATGFVDTNYEGKADAAVAALADHDFVYLHVEAIDECGHMGDLDLKLKAIEDFDRRIVGRVREQLRGQTVTFALLPDHPVPIKLRKHTRTPIPVAVSGPHITPDTCEVYSERAAAAGALGLMQGDQLMRRVLNLP